MNPFQYIKAYFAVKEVAEDIKQAFPPTESQKKMNILIKQVVVWGLEAFVAHEPALVAGIKNPIEKKVLDDAVLAVKALLPVIQAL